MGSKRREEAGFEALYSRLEGTVARLEEGGLTLDESLALYEQGMKLAHRCQEILRSAELKVTKLQETFSEELGALRERGEEYSSELEPVVSQDELPLE